MPLEPTPYVAPVAKPPTGRWVRRLAVALFVERRLPYRLSLLWDRWCKAAGFPMKTVTVDGVRVRVRRLTSDEYFVENILVNHEYNPPGYEIHATDTVIDIGGNIGTFALYAARNAPQGHVYTFEPCGENYDLLSQNLANNGMKNVTAMHAAIVGTPGQVKLNINPHGGLHSIVADRVSNPAQFELVDGIRLQDVFDQRGIARCHLMKIDCEGAEYEILYNLPVEYYPRIDRITMEYHGPADAAERRQKSNELVAFLQGQGYQIDVYQECVGFRCGFIRAARRTA